MSTKKKNNDYDVLEHQLNDATTNVDESLGHLTYDVNNPNQLSDDEKIQANEFLQRAKNASKYNRATNRVIGVNKFGEDDDLSINYNTSRQQDATFDIKDGWIPISRDDMGKRSLFYPESWEFRVRPASVESIKNWSAIDEARPEQVNSVYNEIIKSNLMIKDGNNTISYSQINSWDRFYFIMKIRDFTFSKGESIIEFTDECSECNEEIKFTLKSQSLNYEYPDDEIVEKCWNQEDRQWLISPSDYNVEHDDIILYNPTIGKEELILQYAVSQIQNGKKIDEQFIKFLPWLMKNASKNVDTLQSQINNIRRQYQSWSIDMFLFMQDVIRNIEIVPQDNLMTKCPSCNSEVTSTIKFPNGIKYLFVGENKHRKFGTK